MGYKNREIESKYLLKGADLNWVCHEMDRLLQTKSSHRKWGNSTDAYWTITKTKFSRVRERDGIRQITVKSKDQATGLDRVEIDIESTSSVEDIHAYQNEAHGPMSGVVNKSYYVWQVGASEYDTITAYTVPDYDFLKDTVVLEFEARTLTKVEKLEKLALDSLRQRGNITIERAPGSLHEMLILGKTT